MAHQDYVSRKKAPKKKPTSKKATQQPVGISIKTKLIAVFTLVALAVFSYFLWSLTQTPSNDTNTPINKVEAKKLSNAKEDVELPVFNEADDFEFMKKLKEQEVEPGKYEVKDKGPYLMQCGSFRTERQAQELKANIAFAGVVSQVKETTGSNGVWYKVILGPYERKRLAENDKHKLARNKINYCQIWLWR